MSYDSSYGTRRQRSQSRDYRDYNNDDDDVDRYSRNASSGYGNSGSSYGSRSNSASGYGRPSSSTAADRIGEGDKVEANYRGRGRFYPGHIRTDNYDGTYDIDYDDGEKESGVRKELIRRTSGSSARRERSGSPRRPPRAPPSRRCGPWLARL